MKLTRIAASNFKGANFNEELSIAQIFIGSNFVGKTTRTDAIRLLLLGYLPELGKTAKDTFGLSSGPEMSVEGEFDNGEKIVRKFWLEGNSVRTFKELPASLDGLDQLAVMLNAEEYFSLSDRKRMEYVFSNCQMGDGENNLTIINRLENRLESPEGSDSLKKLIEELKVLPFTTGQEWIDGAINLVTEKGKASKDHGKRMEQTIQGLSALRAQDDPAQSLLSLESRRAEVVKAMADLNEEKGGMMTKYLQIRDARNRRAVIDREINQGTKSREQATTAKIKLELIEKEMLLAGDPPADELVIGAQAKLSEINGRINGLIESDDGREFRVKRLQRELADLESRQTCPYCGAAGSGWKTLKAEEIMMAIEADKASAGDLAKKRDEAVIELGSAKITLGQLMEARKAYSLLKQQKDQTNSLLMQLNPLVARIGALEEERARLIEDDPAFEAKVEALQGQINIKTQEVTTIDRLTKEAMGRKSELTRLAQCEEQRDTAKFDEATAKEVVTELRTIQGELVEGAFKPLLERANWFFSSILISPLAYSNGEIGTWRGGLWVGHRTMSGVEKALCYAAIQAALAMTSPVKVMILDELGRVADANVQVVVEACLAACSNGHLDNFVGIDVGRAELYNEVKRAVDVPNSAFNIREIG